MVKNIPTIERSTKIRFGKYATDDQGENTIVFNASNTAIDASGSGGIYMTPLRSEDIRDPDVKILTYNRTTKEVLDSSVTSDDIFSMNLEFVTNNDNVTSNTVRFINDTTSFVTTGNVGIHNTSPTHALDIGSKFHVTEGGEVRIGPSVLIDSNADNNIQVSGRINTSSITVNRIGLSNTNPTIEGLSLGSTTFLQHPTALINAFSTTGNVSAAFYHGDSYFLSNLNLDNIILQGNTAASKTVEFNKSGTSLITASNVGIANALPVHTLDVGSNLFVDDKGSNKLVVTGNVNVSNYTKTDYITVQKDAHVKGNLLVEGTTTTIDTINTTFGDAVISLANNNILTTTDIGIIMKQPGSNASPTVTFRGDEKEMMIGYTLNSSLDTEITPDSANVIDLHVYGNVIAQNNITLTSGELTAITVNSNVIGNNVDVITLNGNVIGNNVDVITLYGNVIGNNVDVITLTGNVIGNNVNVITLNGNVIADNVYATNNIETKSGFFKGDGGILSNVTLQQVTDTSNSTSNTVRFTNAHTAFTTDLTSNVEVKLNQLSNVTLGTDSITLANEQILVYDGSNWTNQFLNHTFLHVKAEEAIQKGNVVYITSSTGNNTFNVKKANAANSSTMPAIGVAYQDLADEGEGLIVSFGRADHMVLDGFDEGETVYVSNIGSGLVSNVKPLAPTDLIQNVGIVIKPHKSSGVISVTGVGRSNDIPNAQVVTDQPSYVYVNSSGNELKKIDPTILNANNQTLDMVTSWSNSTTNTIASTHATTGFISTGNVHVGSNIFVSGIKDTSDTGHSYIPMIEYGTGKLIRSPAYVASDKTYIINAANAEFTGNLSFTGNTYVFESNTVVINDRILGIANNNTSHTLDVGIIMEHPGHNIAFIHHGEPQGDDLHEHEMVLGYTQNTVSDNHVLDDANIITFRVLGNVIVQNNLTLTSGDLTAITVNSNVVGDTVNVITLKDVITLNGNVSGDNVSVITLNGNVSGDNVSVITLNGNVVSDNVVATNGMYGIIAGSNTISASTIYVGTDEDPNLNGYDLRVEGDTEITGNLLVGGTTTTVNTENLVVKDPIIQLGDASASVDSGLLLARNTGNVYVGYNQTESESEFVIGFTDNHAGESSISVKDGVNFKMNVHGNVEASYFFGDGSQLSGIQTATPTLASVVNEGNTTSNVVQFSNATTGIEITSNIDFVNKITLKSTSGTKSNLFVVNAIQLDPSYAEPTRNVLSYDTTTGEIYDSGGQGGSSFVNITEEAANVLIGSNLTINSFGSNVLTVSGNVSADNITIGGLNVAASPFALDDVVSVYEGANVTANVLTLGGLVTSGNVDAGDITISGNTTSQNIKLTNTDISATISSGTITIDAKEKTYGTAPLVVSTTDVSNLIFSNLITGAQIVVPILASGGAINISSAMTNVNFYAMTTDVSITQDKHALMTLSNLYGNIYMNAIGFS
ncbi:hypothetical protein BpV2_063 [Bathycoccus sp. RCC1105 virus BpV2]|nr:hypothetical protein BpV2_063 [Bathycoccus sp. RCC1105 virus BpV2]